MYYKFVNARSWKPNLPNWSDANPMIRLFNPDHNSIAAYRDPNGVDVCLFLNEVKLITDPTEVALCALMFS